MRVHGVGRSKILVIAVVRGLTGVGRVEAKELVESPRPFDLRELQRGEVEVGLRDGAPLARAGVLDEVRWELDVVPET